MIIWLKSLLLGNLLKDTSPQHFEDTPSFIHIIRSDVHRPRLQTCSIKASVERTARFSAAFSETMSARKGEKEAARHDHGIPEFMVMSDKVDDMLVQ
tara:strand:+ start:16380 stop:16670 length:291 start_codon:yes stop_codon:yes gene_type:complete